MFDFGRIKELEKKVKELSEREIRLYDFEVSVQANGIRHIQIIKDVSSSTLASGDGVWFYDQRDNICAFFPKVEWVKRVG